MELHQLENENTLAATSPRTPVPVGGSFHRALAIGFRWKRRMIFTFFIAAIAGVSAAFWLPAKYESSMKLLVARERLETPVTLGQTVTDSAREISEEELNSEVELIKNDDVLRTVVLETGLSRPPKTGAVQIERAIRRLGSELAITLPKKTDIIRVTYRSKDRMLSAAVLRSLAKAYLEKHLAVHRPHGQLAFFDQQAERTRRSLDDVQAKLSQSARKTQMFAGAVDLDLVVQKLSDERLALQQTYTAIGETQKRITSLRSQLTGTPPRMTTAIRTADNPELLVQLKSTLLQLQLKRTDLLQKFEPTYRSVREVDQQIAQTQAAITAAENAPVMDRTTDRDPTYEWIRSELAKAQTDLTALNARAASISKYTDQYTSRARALSDGNMEQQQLLTSAKALEDTYQLYLRKREEARISDALDQNKILNVSIAQYPSIPVLPTRSPSALAIGAVLFASLLSIGTAVVSDRIDNSFRTPEDVHMYLDIPVIAAIGSADREDARAFNASAVRI